MTDNTSPAPEHAADSRSEAAAPAASGQTAGTLLREARSACGMELSDLARVLKVPERKLEALEADRYADLQSMTFVRALALSACRVMRADAAPILACLPQQTQIEVLDPVSSGLNRPLQELGPRRFWGGMVREQRTGVLITLAFVVGAALMWGLPSGWAERLRARFSQSTTATTVVEEPVPISAPSTDPIASDRLPAAGPQSWSASAPQGVVLPAALPGAVSVLPAAPSAPARSASASYRSASGAWGARSASRQASASVARSETSTADKPAPPAPAPAPAASQ